MKRKSERMGNHGVSPVIATILMVAITVVLAAVLYVLVGSIVPDENPPPTSITFANERINATSERLTVVGVAGGSNSPDGLRAVLFANGTKVSKAAYASGGWDFGSGYAATFSDVAEDGDMDQGDSFIVTGLSSDTAYVVKILGDGGATVAEVNFQR